MRYLILLILSISSHSYSMDKGQMGFPAKIDESYRLSRLVCDWASRLPSEIRLKIAQYVFNLSESRIYTVLATYVAVDEKNPNKRTFITNADRENQYIFSPDGRYLATVQHYPRGVEICLIQLFTGQVQFEKFLKGVNFSPQETIVEFLDSSNVLHIFGSLKKRKQDDELFIAINSGRILREYEPTAQENNETSSRAASLWALQAKKDGKLLAHNDT